MWKAVVDIEFSLFRGDSFYKVFPMYKLGGIPLFSFWNNVNNLMKGISKFYITANHDI